MKETGTGGSFAYNILLRALDVVLGSAIYDASIMRRLGVLLRFALCVSLIFNGSSFAMASAGVQHHGSTLLVAAESVASADHALPCHEQTGSAAEASPDPAAPVSTDGDSQPEQSIPDCCESGSCFGACLLVQSAAVGVSGAPDAAVAHTRSVRILGAGHVSRIPHPAIRPPIG